MIARPAVAFLALWIAIFLGGSVFPAAREWLEQFRGSGHALGEAFARHAAIRTSFAEIADEAAPGAIMAVSTDPPDARRLVQFAEDAKYHLYPRRLFSFANGDPATLTRIVFYGEALRADRLPPTCRQVGAAYRCPVRYVRGIDAPTLGARLEEKNLIVTFDETTAPRGAAVVVSIGFALEKLPATEGFDLDLNVLCSSADGIPANRIVIPLPTAALAPYLRIRIVVLDAEGHLVAGPPESVAVS